MCRLISHVPTKPLKLLENIVEACLQVGKTRGKVY
jgi:hypothetical protein